ncbi:MAG: hypothetical protein ACXIUP_07735 [Microcella sp.]
MVTLLIRLAIFVASVTAGLLLAGLLVEGFALSVSGFVVTVVVFAVLQALLAPLSERLMRKFAPALLGGVGLISTFVALLLASVIPGGIAIAGLSAWVLGTLVVWLVTAIGAALLAVVLRRRAHDRVVRKATAKP